MTTVTITVRVPPGSTPGETREKAKAMLEAAGLKTTTGPPRDPAPQHTRRTP